MRDALVDQATLSAVQRIEGEISARNQKLMDGDLLALENLIRAILFYDNILYVDSGGAKQHQKTHGYFHKFKPVTLENENYLDLIYNTNRVVDELIPCIEGGEFTDECTSAFFRNLSIDIRFLWVQKEKHYCLNHNLIDAHGDENRSYYEAVMSMIFSELQDWAYMEEIDRRMPLLYDSHDQIVHNKYQLKDGEGNSYKNRLAYKTDVLFRALNGLIFRTIFDSMVARELGACAVLYPTRSVFSWYCISDSPDHDSCLDTNAFNIKQNLPMIAPWLALQNPYGRKGFLEMAYALREEKEFVMARRYLDEIYEKIRNGEQGGESMNTLLSAYEEQMEAIGEKYRVDGLKNKNLLLPSFIHCMKGPSEYLSKLANFDFTLNLEDPGCTIEQGGTFALIHRHLEEDLKALKGLGHAYEDIIVKTSLDYDAELGQVEIQSLDDLKKEKWWKSPM